MIRKGSLVILVIIFLVAICTISFAETVNSSSSSNTAASQKTDANAGGSATSTGLVRNPAEKADADSKIVNVIAEYMIKDEGVVILKDQVNIHKETLNLLSDYATITEVNDEYRNLSAEGNIRVVTDTMEASAVKLDFDLKTNIGNLQKNVMAKVRSGKNKEKIILIYCDNIVINDKEKTYIGTSEKSQIKIIQDTMVINSEAFNYNESTKMLDLIGKVHIVDKKKKMDMTADKAYVNTETNKTEATKINLNLEIKDEPKSTNTNTNPTNTPKK